MRAVPCHTRSGTQVSSRVSVVPCDWESVGREALPAAPYALVIAADCVWLEALVQPFINALLTATGPKSKVRPGMVFFQKSL